MTKRLVVGAIFAALSSMATGCSSDDDAPTVECTDKLECKGTPAAGQEWACVANKCVQEPIDDAPVIPTPGTDAGTDAGEPLDENEACNASTECGPDLRCDPAPATGTGATCQPLHIAFTRNVAAVPADDRAVVVRFNQNVASTSANGDAAAGSRFPRWSPDGSKLLFTRDTVATPELVVATPPFTTAATVFPLTTAIDHVEWAPSSKVAWREATGVKIADVSGATLPAPVALGNGTAYPSWNPDGTKLSYYKGGIWTANADGTDAAAVTGGTQGSEPFYNGGFLLYTRAVDAVNPVWTAELVVVPETGGTAAVVVPAVVAAEPSAAAPTTFGSYISDPTWSADGNWVAYTRVTYVRTDGDVLPSGNPAPGTWAVPRLCGEMGAPACPTGTAVNEVWLQKVNPATRVPDAGVAPVELGDGGLAAFSPSGERVAFVSSRRLRVQKINPATGDKVDPVIAHSAQEVRTSGFGDDARPRWQPK